MSNTKISELPAGTEVTSSNLFPSSEGATQTVKLTWAQLRQNIIDVIYPVGSTISTSAWTTPDAVVAALGGTWVRAAEGRVEVGYQASDSAFSTVGATGGSKTVTLTTAQTPAHTHTRGTMEIEGSIRIALLGRTDMETYNSYKALHTLENKNIHWGDESAIKDTALKPSNIKLQASDGWTGATSSVGGGEAHTNLQPYIVRYKYMRTA